MIAEITGHLPLLIVECGTGDNRHVPMKSVCDGSSWRPDACGELCALDGVIVLVMARESVLSVDLYTLNVVLQDEIDDASHRIRPICRRGAAGDHFDPLDQRQRNLIKVRSRVRIAGVGITESEAPPIDEDDGALRTDSAQVRG